MKQLQNLMFFVLLLILMRNSITQTVYNGVGHIPVEDQVDWTNAGLIPEITPTEAEYVFNVSEEKQPGETWFDVVDRGLNLLKESPVRQLSISRVPGVLTVLAVMTLPILSMDSY